MEKKKIVFIIERLSTGGAERVVAALANKLCNDENYDVFIITYFPKEDEEYYISQKIHRFDIAKPDAGRMKTIFLKYLSLKSILKRINPYCVFSLAIPKTNVVLTAAVWKRKYPLIISERNGNKFPYPPFRRRCAWRLSPAAPPIPPT